MTTDTEKLDVSTGVGAPPRCRGLVTCVLHNEVILFFSDVQDGIMQ